VEDVSQIPLSTGAHQKQAVSDYRDLHKALIRGDPRDVQSMIDTIVQMPDRSGTLIIFLMAFLDTACVAAPIVADTLDKILRAYQ
jgi:hypothetical protein